MEKSEIDYVIENLNIDKIERVKVIDRNLFS